MAEAHARFKQFEYKSNASLVLTTDSRPRDTHEPTGEPESLFGKIDPKSFGDRAARGRPPELDEKLKKSKKKSREREADGGPMRQVKRRKVKEESVLTDIDEGVYKPKTKETSAAFEAMLNIVQGALGGQEPGILQGAADEILATLKDDTIKGPDKKKVIEKLLGTGEVFDTLAALGKKITDYQEGSDVGLSSGNGDAVDDGGVAVEFEENEDDDEESDLDMVQEDDEDEDDLAEGGRSGAMQMGGGVDDEDKEGDDEAMNLSVQDIDAYWLQRKISQAYGQKSDPQHIQTLAEEALKILADVEDREAENKLLVHLNYENFDLIKYLLRNKHKIVWCTRIARAEDQEKREKIEEQMMELGPELVAILEQLHATRATPKERQKNLEKSIREEARRLKDGSVTNGDHSRRVVADKDSDGDWLNGQRQLLDLDSIAFEQGGRFMAYKKIELPEGSFRRQAKGYEEVHIPALKAKPLEQGEQMVKISAMPDWAQPAFECMTQLNRVQSKVYETALFSAENILLCAPTGAGKTNVAVLTMLQQFALNRAPDGSFNHSDYKIVYVAPMKALVAEVVGTLSNRLQHYGVNVKELSGDQSLTKQQIDETQIIVTTPEKWDIITRKSGDRTYTQLVKLLIIDEIHLLHDNRGPVLESIVARTVRQIETTKENIRLVGLSATLPNYEDIALFLRVDVKKGLFHFDNSYRPCPLAQQYIGISVKKPLQRFQLMNDVCYEKVMAGAGKHQVLVFVHSRKETAKTARAIRDTALANDTLGRFLKEDSASREILHTHTDLVKSNDLKDLLPYGFAIHHAGMARADRQLVEDLFSDGHVQVLVSTATLAWGVNLPAHTVIIKGTQIYNPEKGAWTELSPLDVMQMLGRAGRPQYDTYGEGIIITGHTELQFYLSLMNQQLPIESQFISKLADQLNAEIVLGTVQNAKEACNWIIYTYLYIRMLRNHALYGIAPDVLDHDVTLAERRADLIHSAATILDKNGLIKYDRKSGYFQVTDFGRIASYYNITHGTISTFNEHLKPTMGDIELCRLFSLSEEFKYVSVRQDEKMELAKLLDRVPIPIKESLEEPSAKINVLLQAYISQLKLEGLSLTSDMVYITQSAARLIRALFEIVLKQGWAQLAEKALNLCKMVQKRMWNVQTPLRKFSGIRNDILMKLEKKDVAWERYYDMSSQQLGELIRTPKLGKTLHKSIHQAYTIGKYVGWEEVYICREKGKREIHYTMKRRDGGKDLAVIAKERSLRHMTYRYLLDFNSDKFTKPRSRRELLDWLNSFLSGEDLRSSDSPQASGGSFDVNETGDLDVEAMKDIQLQKVGSITREFLWIGSSWTCKKKRRHYKAFSRNGFKISVNEFVHVLAEENCRLVAYLDDMYEDSKGNKMVVVRWFHKIDEVGLDLPHDFNDREIFFSLCLQDLSIECIDGLAMVLSPQHYEKFLSVAKHTKLEPYMCNRQYDNDELTSFDITQIKGYWKQDILRYMFSLSSSRPLDKTCLSDDSGKREVNCDGAGTKPRKRLRLSRDHKLDMPCSLEDNAMEIDQSHMISQSNRGLTQGPRVTVSRIGIKVVAPRQAIAVGSVVEVLSQDSGMRGCWFRATVIKKHKNKVKLSYHDIKDAENEANCLEEWVTGSRIVVRDDMGRRLHGRTTIRPSFPSHRGKISRAFNVGAIVDAWQHDGWWEGIVIQSQPNETFRVYFPGEKREAIFGRSDLRHSQEWMGNTWRELSEKPDVAASILSGLVSCDSKQGDCDVRKDRSITLRENNKIVPDLLKDDFLSQLKWKTVGKRRRTRFSVQKLHPRNIRMNSERTVFHSTLKFGKETSDTSKVDRVNGKLGKETS